MAEDKKERIIQTGFTVSPSGEVRPRSKEVLSSAERRESVKQIFVPAETEVKSRPTFSGAAFKRLIEPVIEVQEVEGELFPWKSTRRAENALWYGGTAEGWVAEVLGTKEGEPRRFYRALRQEIRGTIKKIKRTKK